MDASDIAFKQKAMGSCHAPHSCPEDGSQINQWHYQGIAILLYGGSKVLLHQNTENSSGVLHDMSL